MSDGAGSASAGAHGAAYICDELFDQVHGSLPDVSPTRDWLRQCVTRTRNGLLAEAERLGIATRQLAATLLCAVLAEEWSTFAQLGDGAIVTPEVGTDMWAWLFWPHRGEYANTTSFLTDSNAMETLEIDTLPYAQDEIAIFTDGLQHLVLHYDERAVHSPFFERMIGPVRLSSADGEDKELCSGLAQYLGSTNVTSRSDDDLTLVMASRLDATSVATTG